MAPGQSSFPWVSGSRLSGTLHNVKQTTAAAMGILMKNTHRQEPCSTTHPPNTGPSAAVMEVNPDHVPMALPRWFSSNEALISARLPGTSKAAPAPCTPRAMINWLIDGAKPHQADAAAKRTTPETYLFLLIRRPP